MLVLFITLPVILFTAQQKIRERRTGRRAPKREHRFFL